MHDSQCADDCSCQRLTRYPDPIPLADPVTPTVGLRYDTGKAPVDLISPSAMEGLAHVLGYGAAKYSAYNWRKGMAWSKVIACLLRHTFKFMAGEDIDKESGLPHVDLIQANAMFLAEYYRSRKSFDDRYRGDADATPAQGKD